MDDMKYMPMISDRKRTTLVVDPLPTLETAKKNCTENETRQLKFRVTFLIVNTNTKEIKITDECKAPQTHIQNRRSIHE